MTALEELKSLATGWRVEFLENAPPLAASKASERAFTAVHCTGKCYMVLRWLNTQHGLLFFQVGNDHGSPDQAMAAYMKTCACRLTRSRSEA